MSTNGKNGTTNGEHASGRGRAIQRREYGLGEIVGVYWLAQTPRHWQGEYAQAHRPARNRGQALVQPGAINQRGTQHGPRTTLPGTGGSQRRLASAQLS